MTAHAAESPAGNTRSASLDLALIGNCAISALVDRGGAIVWSCMPRFDGDPVFHALLDSADGLPKEGSLLVELEGLERVEQHGDLFGPVLAGGQALARALKTLR